MKKCVPGDQGMLDYVVSPFIPSGESMMVGVCNRRR